MSSLWVSGLFQKAARFLDRRGRWRAYGRLIEMGILAWGSPGERDTEARIVEANDKFGRALGVKLGASDLRGQQGGIPGYSVGGGNYVTVGGNYDGVGGQTNQEIGRASCRERV